jgi:AcrR family transcriptional regulator
MARKSSARRNAVRIGRPPKRLAGEVEERILGAARTVFLERGFEGASIEEIAEAARSGKPTIYARFPDKEALFTAVVMQSVAANIARIKAQSPTGATIEERLENLGATMLQWILVSDAVGLMRVAIAEAHRFPGLASSVYGMARERAAEGLARLLAETARSDELGMLPAFAPEHLPTTTRFFQDVVLFPLMLRALFGEKLNQLCGEIRPHVTRSVAFFLAACRQGGVKSFIKPSGTTALHPEAANGPNF